jgi:hypothetical protein
MPLRICCESAANPLRSDASEQPYQPFHGVHTMFDDDGVRAIGLLARERWRRACGRFGERWALRYR